MALKDGAFLDNHWCSLSQAKGQGGRHLCGSLRSALPENSGRTKQPRRGRGGLLRGRREENKSSALACSLSVAQFAGRARGERDGTAKAKGAQDNLDKARPLARLQGALSRVLALGFLRPDSTLCPVQYHPGDVTGVAHIRAARPALMEPLGRAEWGQWDLP